MNRIQEIWQNKFKIANGIYNYFFGSRKAKEQAKKRLLICQSNKCGQYDKFGESEQTFVKGKPSCAICGCNIKFMCNSQETHCSLIQIGQEPLW